MNWTVDQKRREARSDEDYLITWAENSHGPWFNGWGPAHPRSGKRKHLEASYDRNDVKAACEAHLEKVSRGTKAA